MISTESIARVSARRPWITVAAWILAVIVAMGLIFTMLGDALTTDAGLTSEPESREANRLVGERFRSSGPNFATEVVLVTSDSLTVDDAAFETFTRSLTAALAEGVGDGLDTAASYFDDRSEDLASPDGHTAGIVLVINTNEPGTYRRMTEALGRFISGDLELPSAQAYRQGRTGGTTADFRVHNVRMAGAGAGDVIVVRSEDLTCETRVNPTLKTRPMRMDA